jgi:ELWxxDGT repeat protein
MRTTRLRRLELLLGVIWLAGLGAPGGAARAQTAYLVTDLLPGEGAYGGSNPIDLMPAGKHLFFIAGPTDGTQAPAYTELWVTDGTAAGTLRLPGSAGFVASLGDLLFYEDAGQLWRSDGTRAGTFPLTGAGGGPLASAVLGGVLYYIAYDSSGPSEQLWRSDGTVAGTYLVADVGPGLFDYHHDVLIAAGGKLFFAAPEASPLNAFEDLWSSDGTAQGTGPATGFQQQGLDGLTAAGGRLFFFTMPAGSPNAQLWVSDGTKAGTRLVSSAPGAGWMVAAGKQVVYAAEDSAHLRQIWQSDGTPAGTRQVTSGSGFGPLVELPLVLGTRLVFLGGGNLWGAALGSTGLPTSLCGSGRCGPLFDFTQLSNLGGRVVVFLAGTPDAGYGLWASNGTASGTLTVRRPARPWCKWEGSRSATSPTCSWLAVRSTSSPTGRTAPTATCGAPTAPRRAPRSWADSATGLVSMASGWRAA